MKRIKTLALLAVLAFAGLGGWKVGLCEFDNMQLQADMLDLASGVGSYSSYSTPRSDEDFRQAVIRKALEHDIQLQPAQVMVRRSTSGTTSTMYLAATYTEPVNLPYYSFELHFHPTSEKRVF